MAHVLAKAVCQLFDDVKLAIGPPVDNGFYYDFDLPHTIKEEDFPAIEKRMTEIINGNEDYVCRELNNAEEVLAGEPYKLELVREFKEAGEEVTVYDLGENFFDLCAGPHVANTKELRNWGFKVATVAGAYWRGSSDNAMLQRVYVYAFPTRQELKKYLQFLEEAKKRDHRKLGRELDLFDIYEEGPGFPFFLPKGMVLRNILEDFWRKKHTENGYSEIKTPIILNRDLWLRSGHWEHYKDNMYTTLIDEADFAVKPMNCPGAILVFKRKLHSYRDLPQRIGELGLVHRHELSGALHGLMRVRNFTQDDAHIFMTPRQIKGEVKAVINMANSFYDTFGLEYKMELSTKPENSMGTQEQWDVATNALKEVLDETGTEYIINEGDGAFYGPKIDFHIADCIGRTWQCATIQLDFQMPERFDLFYIGADNEKHRPIMVHHVIFGALERFMAVITEHFAGKFPYWLSPVQIGVVPVHPDHEEYARKIMQTLRDAGCRVVIDTSDGTMGNKIKSFRHQMIPYIVIVGEKEVEGGTVSLRSRSGVQINEIAAEKFVEICKKMENEHLIELIEEV
jgi:threonyl-tRNA synthetase